MKRNELFRARISYPLNCKHELRRNDQWAIEVLSEIPENFDWKPLLAKYLVFKANLFWLRLTLSKKFFPVAFPRFLLTLLLSRRFPLNFLRSRPSRLIFRHSRRSRLTFIRSRRSQLIFFGRAGCGHCLGPQSLEIPNFCRCSLKISNFSHVTLVVKS